MWHQLVKVRVHRPPHHGNAVVSSLRKHLKSQTEAGGQAQRKNQLSADEYGKAAI